MSKRINYYRPTTKAKLIAHLVEYHGAVHLVERAHLTTMASLKEVHHGWHLKAIVGAGS